MPLLVQCLMQGNPSLLVLGNLLKLAKLLCLQARSGLELDSFFDLLRVHKQCLL